MRKSKFTEQQIAFILKQADDGVSVEDTCRKTRISVQTYYRWRQKYGGLMPSEMKRLRQLEEENTAPEGAGGESEPGQGDAPGRHPAKDVKPGRARAVVDYLCDSYRISIRRACRAYPLDRSTYHYRSRRPDQAPLRERIREIAKARAPGLSACSCPATA